MSKEQTAGELTSKWAAVLGGVSTALTLEQLLGLAIGLGGLAASWWLAIMKNKRDKLRLEMEQEERAMRLEMEQEEHAMRMQAMQAGQQVTRELA